MTVYHGNGGVCKVSSNSIAEVEGWSYRESDPALKDIATLGDSEVTHKASGAARGEGSFDCLWDDSDTNGQLAMTIGSTVTLNLYPGGESANKYRTGDVVVESIEETGVFDDLVKWKVGYRGVLTLTTIT